MSIVSKGVIALFGFSFVLVTMGMANGDGGKRPAGAQPAQAEAATVKQPLVERKEAPEPHSAVSAREALNDSSLVSSASEMSKRYGGDGDGIALMINLDGELCAYVDTVTYGRKPDTFEVSCIAQRNGAGGRRYLIDLPA